MTKIQNQPLKLATAGELKKMFIAGVKEGNKNPLLLEDEKHLKKMFLRAFMDNIDTTNR